MVPLENGELHGHHAAGVGERLLLASAGASKNVPSRTVSCKCGRGRRIGTSVAIPQQVVKGAGRRLRLVAADLPTKDTGTGTKASEGFPKITMRSFPTISSTVEAVDHEGAVADHEEQAVEVERGEQGGVELGSGNALFPRDTTGTGEGCAGSRGDGPRGEGKVVANALATAIREGQGEGTEGERARRRHLRQAAGEGLDGEGVSGRIAGPHSAPGGDLRKQGNVQRRLPRLPSGQTGILPGRAMVPAMGLGLRLGRAGAADAVTRAPPGGDRVCNHIANHHPAQGGTCSVTEFALLQEPTSKRHIKRQRRLV
jgi:hypothetical protein